MASRIERDSMGEMRVDESNEWGAQTQRSFENFKIGGNRMPFEIIRALAQIKRAAALTNAELGVLEPDMAKAIVAVCDEILAGQKDDQFPLVVWQTGSGTQTNMNVNEVIAHGASAALGRNVHPNDHVNKAQSSNDDFPAAIHIAAATAVAERLLPALDALAATLERLADEYADVVKTGRTHLQDAVPVTLGQEIGAWAAMVRASGAMIGKALEDIWALPLGGTAVGTGLGAKPEFGKRAVEKIAAATGRPFREADNKFRALSSKDAVVFLHGALKTAACNLMKIANDVRWLASGPRCGIGELLIPENEPGSSIMPGKVNPTQCEALTMVCCEVMGNDAALGFAASQGNFQLNVYMPLIAFKLLESINLLADAADSFDKNCARGIRPNREVIARNLGNSLMLVTALSPRIGYDRAAEVAKHAHKEGLTLRESAAALGYLSGEEYDALVDPAKMV